ncbi:hypothetical protein G7Y89_g2366 [Cudoniella acicularis]|uniref:Protein transport protein SEC31 n=1 Tax=Cudoniella acicularis TaxID=354080 RepID=A0A8H4RUM7_9HELO|nr:hypothetical protein G7Y89_g2366 [Cudoniella acicularis]
MVRLREIPRTAAFAWSPGADVPLVVTGTRAGAVDADFSDETKLELWDLSLDNLEQGVELQPVASISTDSRFHDIAWAPANAEHPKGIIAGALENGSLDLWDAEKLINGAEDAFMSRTTKHTGAIKSLQFNPLKPQILATAGAKGELFIYDVNDISNPFRLGTAAARSDDLECVAWNRKVPHILATGGSGGFVTVWDLKTKKASLTLNNNRKAVGAIAWDPNNATKLLTATPDDSSPVILLWDLRNSNAPERTLQGHDQGILSLSWCQQDSDLLLSCGKDNRTLVWNPQTGERFGEFPEVTNWTFQTRFNPHNPALSATASFDGKISIQTLQNTNPTATQTQVAGPVDGEDFFTKAQTQPQGASFSLKKAPKWLERPVGASFGFGGKIVSFKLLPTPAGQQRSSQVQISNFSVDSDVGSATEAFEKALVAGNISSISENPRKKVTEYLGFNDEVEEATNGIAGLDLDESGKAEDTSETANGAAAAKNSRLSSLFADGADGDDFLSTIAATKGAKTDNPFHLFSDGDSASQKQITKALMLGQFEKAMTICLKEDRIADALIIANCGGKELLEKAQTAYLSRKAEGPSYLRLLSSVIGKNLWDVVYNADLTNWKESMATLCTYADPNEFPDLCEALGDRIIETGSLKDASFCYLVGSKLEKVINIWITELQEAEKAGIEDLSGDSTFSVHARSLQNFIEKVTVFRDVTKFQDSERGLTSGWKLAPLYEKYTEYADIVAAHGHLSIAERYLDLLPTQYPAAEVARNRVKLASRKAPATTTKATRHEQTSTMKAPSHAQPGPGYQPMGIPAATPGRPAGNAFTPTAPTSAPNPYAPPTSTYAPQQQGYQQPQSQPAYGAGYNQGYGSASGAYGTPPPAFGAPPRNTTPSAPPPSKAKDMVNWNDTPMVTKPPTARRSTPVAAAITSPFPNQQNLSMPPPNAPFGGPRATPTPPPPPPKGPAPPRISSPLASGPPHSFQQQARPSSAANTYAPQAGSPAQQYGHPAPPPTIPRGASPYNPPPAGPPQSSRYAPAPAAQQYSQPPAQSSAPPPPQAGNRPPPPANPYAPPMTSTPNQYAPSQSPYEASQPPQAYQSQSPPSASQGPPQGSRPPTGPPKAAAPPAKPKHPAGDRSHIPASAQRMVEIFSSDMQRVASKAPPAFAAQVKDTQKRLNILFDHLNNEELVKPDTIARLNELAEALQSRNYDSATRLQVEIQREKTEECGNWMVGVKRLVGMTSHRPHLLLPIISSSTTNMCPSCEPEATTNSNGHTNSSSNSNGATTNGGSNGNAHPGFTAVETKSNPHPHRSNPYQPVGDFLSNVNNFKIIESTLREGEQFANAFFDTAKKIEIAKALDDFGVDYIELTSPAASEQSRADCEAICKLGLKAKILTHIRCHMDDARIAVQTGVDGVDVVIGTSSYLMEHSHGKDMTYITNTAIEVINYVKSHNIEIRFSSEDSFRSNLVDLLSIYSTVDKIGVNRVGIADTVGCASPRQVYDLIRTLRGVVSCDIETHFHNDTGCAIANAYCALEAGATHIDTSVLGIGERNGITPLGGLMARMIVADREYVMGKYKLHKLKDIEDLVAQAVEVNIPFNNYVTGFCAFTHKAGIHAKAILNNPSTYEIINPADFGMSRYVHFASRLTGWNAIKSRAAQLNIEMTDAQYKECTAKIKQLADVRPIAIDDADSIIRAFHRGIKLGKEVDLLPNMTEEEKQLLAKEKEIDMPEKRRLDAEADIPIAKKARNGITA